MWNSTCTGEEELRGASVATVDPILPSGHNSSHPFPRENYITTSLPTSPKSLLIMALDVTPASHDLRQVQMWMRLPKCIASQSGKKVTSPPIPHTHHKITRQWWNSCHRHCYLKRGEWKAHSSQWSIAILKPNWAYVHSVPCSGGTWNILW